MPTYSFIIFLIRLFESGTWPTLNLLEKKIMENEDWWMASDRGEQSSSLLFFNTNQMDIDRGDRDSLNFLFLKEVFLLQPFAANLHAYLKYACECMNNICMSCCLPILGSYLASSKMCICLGNYSMLLLYSHFFHSLL